MPLHTLRAAYLSTPCLSTSLLQYTSRLASITIITQQQIRYQSTGVVTRANKDEKLFDKILVANRGEIACRVFRTCQKLGIKTVAVYSTADQNSVHTKMADEAICVGPAATSESYLNIDAIMAACKSTGAQAVHPGYGFLSENKIFQQRLQEAGIKFIGPGTEAITAMGDKITSKLVAKKANVNIIPGHLGRIDTREEILRTCKEIGYPVMVKASAGGGGKGMRVAYNDEEALDGYRMSQQEAKSSFGDDTMFIEKFIEEPRHIEIQLIADSHGNCVYLNERECSIQRRNQKVIEEAPSVFLTPETRKAMGEQAVALATAVNYESAGTVEFLVDKNRSFYFLEMNTRLQVEHPITEQITGVDIVEEMIRVAAGHKLNYKQSDIGINGWAFESRVYAEDPLKGFLPSIGRLQRYVEPRGSNVRVDSGIKEGSEISVYYDPMISKLVTYGKDRDQALQYMREALDSYVIRGVTHNINFLRSLCDHPRFIEGRLTTNFIPDEYPQGYKGAQLSDVKARELAAAATIVYSRLLLTQLSISGKSASFNPTNIHKSKLQSIIVTVGAQQYRINVTDAVVIESSQTLKLRITPLHTPSAERLDAATTLQNENIAALQDNTVELTEQAVECTIESTYQRGDVVFTTTIDGASSTLQIQRVSDGSNKYVIQASGTAFVVDIHTEQEAKLARYMPVIALKDTSKLVLSPMPGVVFSVNVKVGDKVVPGQEVAVVEAMKMQNALRAVSDGVVKAVHVKKGQTVAADETLIELE